MESYLGSIFCSAELTHLRFQVISRMNSCQITATIPTYHRTDKLLDTLEQILACSPSPDEIIVHIDNNDQITKQALENSPLGSRSEIRMMMSTNHVGPGGGRNRAIAAAKNAIVASFDDDSYPIDSDYFARLMQLFDAFPTAAVIGSAIYHQNEPIPDDRPVAAWVADFIGCGCAYRKSAFLQTTGYVPLAVAYDMEETDLSLRLHDMGWRILHSPWLRVFHNTALQHHQTPQITAASITNRALLTYLRYPAAFWWLGLAQCCSRIAWLMRHQRLAGIIDGLTSIPGVLYHHQHYRQIVHSATLKSYFNLRRQGIHELFQLDLLSTRCS